MKGKTTGETSSETTCEMKGKTTGKNNNETTGENLN